MMKGGGVMCKLVFQGEERTEFHGVSKEGEPVFFVGKPRYNENGEEDGGIIEMNSAALEFLVEILEESFPDDETISAG